MDTRNKNKSLFMQLKEVEQSSFLNQEIDIKEYLYMPNGLEVPTSLAYLFLFPYGIGLIFLFVYFAEGDYSAYLAFDILPVTPIWVIGYEISAGIILLQIIYSAIFFRYKKRSKIAYLEKMISATSS